MKRLSGYSIATIIAIAALIPPNFYEIKCATNTTAWLWGALISGFLAFMFLFTKSNGWVKALVLYCFINCFFSRAPHISFTMFFSVIVCAYFYLLCLHNEGWTIILNTIQSLFLLSTLLIVMQAFKCDTLLNFDRSRVVFYGSINNTMMLASYITCLAPFLIIRNKYYIIPVLAIAVMSNSAGMVLSLAAGIVAYAIFKVKNKIALVVVTTGVLLAGLIYTYCDLSFGGFFIGSGARFPVWGKTLELLRENPYSGFGIGTFKALFPVLSEGMMPAGNSLWHSWLRPHNCWIQFMFELGYVGFIIVLGFVGYLIHLFKKSEKTNMVILAISGLAIIGVNMIWHFPTRLTQIVLILICYLAFFERLMKKEISI